MTHTDPQEISCYVDGELDEQAAGRVRAHLASCDACRGLEADFLALRARVAAVPLPADRLAARGARARVLSEAAGPRRRATVAVPVPALAALVVALVASLAALVYERREPERPPAAAEPATPAARTGVDPARFDRGERMEIFVARRERPEAR